MSILIPGVSMPKDGEMLVLCVGPNGKVLHPIEFATEDFLFAETGKTAIELPPHGRLIDADALNDLLIKLADNKYTPKVFASWLSYEENAPTIIPAEGGIDNG